MAEICLMHHIGPWGKPEDILALSDKTLGNVS